MPPCVRPVSQSALRLLVSLVFVRAGRANLEFRAPLFVEGATETHGTGTTQKIARPKTNHSGGSENLPAWTKMSSDQTPHSIVR